VTLAIDPGLVTAFVLALVRASAWVLIAPPFNARGIPARVKIGLAAALALAIAPGVATGPMPLDTAGFVNALLTQVFAGLTLGFLTYLLLSAVQAAGSLIDVVAGYSIATLYDPLSDAAVPVFGRFYQVVAIALLFAVDGHILLVRGFMRSFDAVPITGVQLAHVDRVLTHDLGVFFVSAIEIAAPVVAVMFVTELALGVLSRAAPQMNIFALGFTVRVFVVLGIVAVALPLVLPAMRHLVEQAITQGAALFGS
jgi:flagellar biosynthetic protein FliR